MSLVRKSPHARKLIKIPHLTILYNLVISEWVQTVWAICLNPKANDSEQSSSDHLSDKGLVIGLVAAKLEQMTGVRCFITLFLSADKHKTGGNNVKYCVWHWFTEPTPDDEPILFYWEMLYIFHEMQWFLATQKDRTLIGSKCNLHVALTDKHCCAHTYGKDGSRNRWLFAHFSTTF